MEFTREITEALGAAFPEDEVEFLPRGSYNGKARALAYIDARSVMRRLDAVVGPGNWHFDFDTLSPDGKLVKGKLTVLGVTKCDAGEGSTEDEPLKSAVSDALKRCAVHFGIGRYLYYLPQVWAAYDQQKRRFTEEPWIAPEAVARALAICGIPAPGRTTAARRAQHTEPSAPPSSGTGTSHGSIWTAGEAPASPGDRVATGQPVGRFTAPRSGTSPQNQARTAQGVQRGETGHVTDQVAKAGTPAPQPSGGMFQGDPAALVCSGSGCNKALTRGQHDISLRAFGQPLCPACQKEKARAAA